MELSKSELFENFLQSQMQFFCKKVGKLPYPISVKELARFCEKHGIKSLALFGSCVTGDFKPFVSDIDVMIELGITPDLFEIVKMEEELKSIFSYEKVDLKSRQEISPEVLRRIADNIEVLYEKAI